MAKTKALAKHPLRRTLGYLEEVLQLAMMYDKHTRSCTDIHMGNSKRSTGLEKAYLDDATFESKSKIIGLQPLPCQEQPALSNGACQKEDCTIFFLSF